MNYRSGCFLAEVVTTKKPHFQLPTLLIFKPCFILCQLVSLSTRFKRAKVSLPPSFSTPHPPLPTPKDAAGSYKTLKRGTSILSYSCSTSRAVTCSTEQTHVTNTCDKHKLSHGERQRLRPIKRSFKTLLEQNWDIWPFLFLLNKCTNFYSEPI